MRISRRDVVLCVVALAALGVAGYRFFRMSDAGRASRIRQIPLSRTGEVDHWRLEAAPDRVASARLGGLWPTGDRDRRGDAGAVCLQIELRVRSHDGRRPALCPGARTLNVLRAHPPAPAPDALIGGQPDRVSRVR